MKKIIIKIIIYNILICFVFAYLYNFDNVKNQGLDISTTINKFMSIEPKYLIYMIIIINILIAIFMILFNYKTLDDIDSKKVGDGQYGNAEWMDIDEVKNTFSIQKTFYDKKPGWYVGTTKDGKILIEEDDRNIMVECPPGGGKTLTVIMPNFIKSMIMGETIIGTDSKSATFDEVKHYTVLFGYTGLHFDFRNPFKSHRFNLLASVSKYIDMSILTDDNQEKIIYKAKAQRYAKIISSSIIASDGIEKGGNNKYFYDVAEGIITSVILLICEYCDEKDRHIVNVLRIVAEGMQVQDNSNDVSRTKLFYMLDELASTNKIKWFGEAAVNSDIRTSMNTFSTALSKMLSFIDDEIEQIICFETDFDIDMLFEKSNKYLMIFNMPEENKSRHFLTTLMYNVITNQLIEKGSSLPGGKLPFIVRTLNDEFGTWTAIPNIENMLTAQRSRGIYSMLIIQNENQVIEKYGRDRANIIFKACQNVMFSALSSNQYDEAKKFSEAIGNETVLNASISKKNSNSKIYNPGQISTQMVGKPLIRPDEIMRLEFREWIILRAGSNPLKTKLDFYWNYIPKPKELYMDKSIDIKNTSYIEFEHLFNKVSKNNNNKDKNIVIQENNINNKSDLVSLHEVEEDYFNFINSNEINNDCKTELIDFLNSKNDIESIQLFATKMYRQLIEVLYQYHKTNNLEAKSFMKFKKYLNNIN